MADPHLADLYAGAKFLDHIFDQFAKIHPIFGGKIENNFAAVKKTFDLDQLHRQVVFSDELSAAEEVFPFPDLQIPIFCQFFALSSAKHQRDAGFCMDGIPAAPGGCSLLSAHGPLTHGPIATGLLAIGRIAAGLLAHEPARVKSVHHQSWF